MASSVFLAVVVLCGLAVFVNATMHIKFKFSHQTPLLIRLGAVLVAAGCALYFLDPVICGGMVVIGQAALIAGERRRHSIFSRNAYHEHPFQPVRKS